MERFGRYILLERIAHGGMAEVFRAATMGSEGFAKQVAIKRILPHLASEKAFVTMLVDEAKIAATLNHPNVLQVLDLGRESNTYFIAMEFVAGQSLNHVVAMGLRAGVKLPPAFSFHVMMHALRGLAFAHEKTDAFGQPMGIIHRDVSPQNIMVSYDGSVRLADFGIAKAAERSTQTLTGSLKGKPAYMAPEQVQERDFDQRVDVYAMGVVLHELLSMKRMRRAQTDVAVLLDVASGKFPRFEDIGVDLPQAAKDVVYRALEPDPDSRWTTATEMADAMEEAAAALGWHFTPGQVAQQMGKLFPTEISKERDRQGYFQAVLQELTEAPEEEVSTILQRETDKQQAELDSADGAAPPTPSRPSVAPARNTNNVPTQRTPAPSPGQVAVLTRGTGSNLVAPPMEQPAPPPRSKAPLVVAAMAALLTVGAGVFVVTQKSGSGAAKGVGQVIVESTPPGARVTVAGRVLEGTTPTVADAVPAGPVEILVEKAGHERAKEVAIVAAGGTTKVRLTLAALVKKLPVDSTPSGASVFFNGARVGDTPLTLTVGEGEEVRVRLELADHVPVEKILAAGSVPERLAINLDRKPADATPGPGPSSPGGKKGRDRNDDPPVRGGGAITLQSRPWARILVDGKDTGRFTPVADMPLSVGKHTIKLINDEEDLSATFPVTIKAGQTVNVMRELK